ncbi:uncharacterized protein LOC126381808 [Pectinophora gossypiella]|uniref:uncharacterized protein LOC126381808 n=1 Tax=Pectinophora gossypiella TaxID=13191 RepID=UPI00214F4FAB|nr:uncharacterized protein LOC126381808 [Pectinophora gossypiella]
MWRTIATSMVLSYAVFIVSIATAPAYPNLRGTHYTISNAEHRIEVRNATYHGSGPREEARAMCSVKTQEVNATANATITRRLHGVVTSRELHSSIQRLEVIIFGQMQQLWQSLDALRAQLGADTRTQAHYPDRRTVMFQYKPDRG